MPAAGLLDEMRALRARYPLHRELPSMRAVGYRQAWTHLQGEISREEFVTATITATRGLAKRQVTWLRSMVNAQRVDPGAADSFDRVLALLDAAQ